MIDSLPFLPDPLAPPQAGYSPFIRGRKFGVFPSLRRRGGSAAGGDGVVNVRGRKLGKNQV